MKIVLAISITCPQSTLITLLYDLIVLLSTFNLFLLEYMLHDNKDTVIPLCLVQSLVLEQNIILSCLLYFFPLP